jgi:hypothetical protein
VFPATWWFILFRKHINLFAMKDGKKKVEAPQKPKKYVPAYTLVLAQDGSMVYRQLPSNSTKKSK